ncbi:mucin-1-like [Asparagus officinalis]|uniref:mucin-1-like n=1 Tax=Asparagus officinalis TaxID=4686 RepID=UPI00098E77D9|nr:mucin-1-like [Asparagus officinalis]
MDLPRSPALESGGLEENSFPSPSALMSQAGDLISSPTTGLMNKPAARTDLPEPSAAQDDEEQVDYDDSPTGDAANGYRGNEDADVGNMSGGGEGSPSPGTTAAATSEPEPAQVSAPLEEQHLPGSSTATASPAALPETTAATPPPKQQLVQALAPMQEQALRASSTVAASSAALMKISLVPTEAGPSASPVRTMMALTSSPSQLDIMIASLASSRSSPSPIILGSSSTSPKKSLNPVVIPSILKVLIRPLEDMMKIAIEEISAGRASFDFFKPILMNSLSNV